MKEFYKKPEFYYFILPVFVIVWILTVAFLSLPTAESKLERAIKDRENIQRHVSSILLHEPERLEYKDQVEKTGKFDYAVVIENFAKLQGILSSDYSMQSQGPIKRGKQLTQSANIIIKSIDIERFAKFLSSIQRSWPNLQCDTLTLKKQKNAPDSWEAKMKFTYVFKK
jgi:hypothetical protein